jgi:hypothetical protein
MLAILVSVLRLESPMHLPVWKLLTPLGFGAVVLLSCQGAEAPPSVEQQVSDMRAMVRPLVQRNEALRVSTGVLRPGAEAALQNVVVAHIRADGSRSVGCVASEDEAEDFVRRSEGAR